MPLERDFARAVTVAPSVRQRPALAITPKPLSSRPKLLRSVCIPIRQISHNRQWENTSRRPPNTARADGKQCHFDRSGVDGNPAALFRM